MRERWKTPDEKILTAEDAESSAEIAEKVAEF
jgi:hypothetical protein